MDDKKPIEIYYWPLRGLVQTALYICEYQNVPYEFKTVTSRDEWIKSKPELQKQGLDFPNLPYIRDPNCSNKLISESLAIFYYLATAGNSTSILPDNENLVEYSMYLGVIQDIRSAFTSPAYRSKSIEELKQTINSFLDNECEKLES